MLFSYLYPPKIAEKIKVWKGCGEIRRSRLIEANQNQVNMLLLHSSTKIAKHKSIRKGLGEIQRSRLICRYVK